MWLKLLHYSQFIALLDSFLSVCDRHDDVRPRLDTANHTSGSTDKHTTGCSCRKGPEWLQLALWQHFARLAVALLRPPLLRLQPLQPAVLDRLGPAPRLHVHAAVLAAST